jgi:hypothetical protein
MTNGACASTCVLSGRVSAITRPSTGRLGLADQGTRGPVVVPRVASGRPDLHPYNLANKRDTALLHIRINIPRFWARCYLTFVTVRDLGEKREWNHTYAHLICGLHPELDMLNSG